MKDLLSAGKIVNTHALKGEVRIYPYCDSAEFLCEFDRLFIDGCEKAIASARVHKGQALIKFEGVENVNQAELLVGSIVYIDKNDIELEEGRYFVEDIKGMSVRDYDTDEIYGTVTNVIETGANDVYEIKSPGGKTYLIPKIDDVVKNIDLESKTILITPMKGLFDL